MATGTSESLSTKNVTGKVGSYAISTVDFSSWANSSTGSLPTPKTHKARGVKEVVNPVFAECAAITDDPFWAEKFTNASVGKFPQKFNYHDGILNYRKGERCHTLELTNNPYDNAYACMEFFRINGGIFSPTDEQNSTASQFSRAGSSVEKPLTWGTANKKIQETLLSYYLTNTKKKLELTSSEVEELRQQILLGIANKFFGDHNIVVSEDRVQSVNGLVWDEKKRVFFIDPGLKPLSSRSYSRKKETGPAIEPSQRDMIPTFRIRWEKYLDTLEKKILARTRRTRRITVNHLGSRSELLSSTANSVTQTSLTDVTSATRENNDEDE